MRSVVLDVPVSLSLVALVVVGFVLNWDWNDRMVVGGTGGKILKNVMPAPLGACIEEARLARERYNTQYFTYHTI